MIRSSLKGQRGGVALLTALGFLLFSIPLITGSLGLAQTINVDARVKTAIVRLDYCGLGVHQYIDYLRTDTGRWDEWLDPLQNPDLSIPSPGVYLVDSDLCGETINVGLEQQAVLPPESYTSPQLGDPLITIPGLSDYNNRRFQTFKTVSDSNPAGGESITYTITVVNRNDTPVPLLKITDTLPLGFAFDWSAATPQLTQEGIPPENLIPEVIPGGGCVAGLGCIGNSDILLVLDNSGSIDDAELDLLKVAANLLVDTFTLDATDGAIIGVTRFRGVRHGR